MARYEDMDDVLRRVRERMVEVSQPSTCEEREVTPSFDVLHQEDHYERVEACVQTLTASSELLRELLASEHLAEFSSAQHSHLLSALNSILQQLWSSEVSLRRAALPE